MKIYLIEGSTGEYGDSDSWIVCAYLDKGRALRHAAKATLRARDIREGDGINEYDSGFRWMYPGTEYHILASELVTDLKDNCAMECNNE